MLKCISSLRLEALGLFVFTLVFTLVFTPTMNEGYIKQTVHSGTPAAVAIGQPNKPTEPPIAVILGGRRHMTGAVAIGQPHEPTEPSIAVNFGVRRLIAAAGAGAIRQPNEPTAPPIAVILGGRGLIDAAVCPGCTEVIDGTDSTCKRLMVMDLPLQISTTTTKG